MYGKKVKFRALFIFLVLISLRFLMSVGDLKYTTFSSRDLTTKKIVRINEIKIKKMKKALNLTFFPYM